jgi:hypothetical protein
MVLTAARKADFGQSDAHSLFSDESIVTSSYQIGDAAPVR